MKLRKGSRASDMLIAIDKAASDPKDWRDVPDLLMFQVCGAFAEFERSMIRQRVHAMSKEDT
jgi:DNA invertase Pin-like site-specific DNA recombinase